MNCQKVKVKVERVSRDDVVVVLLLLEEKGGKWEKEKWKHASTCT